MVLFDQPQNTNSTGTAVTQNQLSYVRKPEPTNRLQRNKISCRSTMTNIFNNNETNSCRMQEQIKQQDTLIWLLLQSHTSDSLFHSHGYLQQQLTDITINGNCHRHITQPQLNSLGNNVKLCLSKLIKLNELWFYVPLERKK